jgi:hypothetical protein
MRPEKSFKPKPLGGSAQVRRWAALKNSGSPRPVHPKPRSRIEMLPPRSLRAFSLVLLLGAAAGTGAHESSAYIQDLQGSLVAYSASDFAASDSRPDDFRKVGLRYRENDHGARSYMLCGQARMGAGAKADWVDFATIKTDPYEQWIGGTATDMCARAVPISTDGSDLSAALQAKLDDNPPAGKP